MQKVNADYKKFDPKNFGEPTGDLNRWYPLIPGSQTLRDGSITRGSRKLTHRLRVTVTDVTKEVNGVRTVLVLDQDIDAGQVGEASVDYLAQDKFGNIWYLGSYTERYEGGEFVNAVDAWLAGENDSKPGVWMLTDPKEGMKFVQAQTSEETIRAEVAKVDERKCVPFDCFKSLAILEDGSEFKYYGPGVGHIATEPNYSGGEQEKEELVNVVRLKPKGLAEMSAEALKLDRRASKEAKQRLRQLRAGGAPLVLRTAAYGVAALAGACSPRRRRLMIVVRILAMRPDVAASAVECESAPPAASRAARLRMSSSTSPSSSPWETRRAGSSGSRVNT